MADQITRHNDRARQAAQKASRPTYPHQVIDVWPACVDCGQTIRGGIVSRYRRCDCPGRRWDHDYGGAPGGWRIVEADDTREGTT